MTLPVLPQTTQPANSVVPPAASPGTNEALSVAAEFRMALASALGEAGPNTNARRTRAPRDGTTFGANTSRQGLLRASQSVTGDEGPILDGTLAAGAGLDGSLTATGARYGAAGTHGVPLEGPHSPKAAAPPGDELALDLGPAQSSRAGMSLERRAPDAGTDVRVSEGNTVVAIQAIALPFAPVESSSAPSSAAPGSAAAYAGLTPAIAPTPLTPSAALGAGIAEPRRDLGELHSEFRTRLERVVDRMQREFGVTVDVVETVRSQDRQEDLYAQGRSRPGQIVTWTRQSNHSLGLAADVTVNGGWTDRAGFERLARIARDEGLRTLWPRDPGHIELVSLQPTEGRVPHTVPRATLPPDATGEALAAALRARAPRQGADRPLSPNDGPSARSVPQARETASILPDLPAPQLGEGMRTLPFAPPREPGDGVRTLPFAPPREPGQGVRILPFLPETDEGERMRGGLASEGRAATNPSLPLGGVARVAQVARVAEVAQVARVAATQDVSTGGRAVDAEARGIARHRRVAAAGLAASNTQSGVTAPIGHSAAPLGGANAESPGHDATSRDRGSRNYGDTGSVAVEAQRSADADLLRSSAVNNRTAESQLGEIVGAEPIERTDAAERIARALRVQESLADRPMSSVVLRLDHADGGEDRIRVDLRGTSVGATFDVRDRAAADQLRAHAPELQAALERRGLDGEGIAVRTLSRAGESTVSLASAASAEREALRAGASSSGTTSNSRDGRTPWRGERDDAPTDHSTSRQRREQKGQR